MPKYAQLEPTSNRVVGFIDTTVEYVPVSDDFDTSEGGRYWRRGGQIERVPDLQLDSLVEGNAVEGLPHMLSLYVPGELADTAAPPERFELSINDSVVMWNPGMGLVLPVGSFDIKVIGPWPFVSNKKTIVVDPAPPEETVAPDTSKPASEQG